MERAITLRARNLRKGKKQDISVLRSLEREILEDFLANISVTRLISPNFGWADVIPQRVMQPATNGSSVDNRIPAGAGSARSTNGRHSEPEVDPNGQPAHGHSTNGQSAHGHSNGEPAVSVDGTVKV
jgi:hypothetical protein